MGLLAIRSHVDTTDDRLLGVEALLDVRAKVAPYLDLQLVAFPQDGLFRTETGLANLTRALDMGVDVVGGIPHFERTMEEGARSVRTLAEHRRRRAASCSTSTATRPTTPSPATSRPSPPRPTASASRGRAAGSHLTSMHSMDNYYVSKLLPLIAEAGVAAIPNPLINITLQGRHDTYPKRRGLTRVKELRAHGVTVGWGQDCVLDPWYSLGTADMLDVAFMGLHVAQMTSPDDMRACFTMVTEDNARILNLAGLRPPPRRPRQPRRPRRRRPDRGPPPPPRPPRRRLPRPRRLRTPPHPRPPVPPRSTGNQDGRPPPK